eukprot:gnl/TRDRNA2_/TRDRNA2_165716_c0_seq2.p1 gnl/TRDRNA2_/TRDRNA2_165716_c0~~gnl/TRDRNA2_/TRDRNA2_165716_c0_seq2.p1  ORF type:complete len:145 (+),score=21.49 gnl/TRDRNA2_/TRDRNA2_165716_c0_seq2:54-488(+)
MRHFCAPSSIHRDGRMGLTSQDTLLEGNSRLQQTKVQALEMEDCGVEIVQNLRGQSETLRRAQSGARDLHAELSISSRLLQAMNDRERRSELLVHFAACWGIMIASVAILLVLFPSWFARRKQPPPAATVAGDARAAASVGSFM